MSRVERKRLEKEAKKKNRFFFGRNKNDDKLLVEKNSEISAKKSVSEKSVSRKKEVVLKKETPEKTEGFYTKEIEKLKRTNKFDTIEDKPGQGGDTKNIAEFYNNTTGKKKMMTADRIISVEDERMRFERKQRLKANSTDNDESVLTVDGIFTVEDIENGLLDVEVEEPIIPVIVQEDEDIEPNINEIKRLNIEEAPFEDVIKVAESRLASESEDAKKKALSGSSEKKDQPSIDTESSIDDVSKNSEEDLKDNKNDAELKKIVVNSEMLVNSEEESNKVLEVIESKQVNMNNIDNSQEGQKGGIKSTLKKILGIIVILIIVIYGIGCVVFNNRFFANTKVNGIDVSYKTPAELDKLAEKKLDGYKLKIQGRNDVKDEISGKDIDLKYSKDGSAQKIKEEQGFWAWPLAFKQGEKIDGKLNISFDQAKFDKALESFSIFKKEYVKAPVSAYPDYDVKEKKMIINKGDLGSTPIKEKVSAFVKESLKKEDTEVSYADSVYKPQNNTASDPRIKKAIETIEPYTKLKIVYDFDKEKYTVSGQEIVKMFKVDSENDYSVELSKDNVREFVRSLSRKYSTYGNAREIMSASTGKKIKVTGGFYGWLIDREGETDELFKLLKEKKDIVDRKPLYAQTAYSRENNDLGNAFIEIDLTKQHMWFVKDNKVLVETPIVSGKPSEGSATPAGIYPINYKTRNATLRGPGYASPVSYWMPFNGDIGIHDANWQPYFGGSRYLYGGSHGCINTPYSKVAEFYKLTEKGMPVVLHY